MHMVTAWRLMLTTLLGHVDPNLPADIIFTNTELTVLRAYAYTNGLPEHTDLASAVRLVAWMGGYRNRKHDPPPGGEIMWRGYITLLTWAVARQAFTIYDMVERPPSIATGCTPSIVWLQSVPPATTPELHPSHAYFNNPPYDCSTAGSIAHTRTSVRPSSS